MHTELSRSTKPVPPETRETRFDGPQPRGVRAQAVLGASGSTRPAAGGARLAHRRQWRRPARTISESMPLEYRATARRAKRQPAVRVPHGLRNRVRPRNVARVTGVGADAGETLSAHLALDQPVPRVGDPVSVLIDESHAVVIRD